MVVASPSPALVACNIYISAAASRPCHSATLLTLLQRAQDHCRQILIRDAAAANTTNSARSGSAAASKANNNNNNNINNNSVSPVPIVAPVAIVHAYADIPYDRSSIHLAGYSNCVSDVASALISNAFRDLGSDYCHDNVSSNNDNDSGNMTNRNGVAVTRHPTVGLVDHVSVMPLILPKRASFENNSDTTKNNDNGDDNINNDDDDDDDDKILQSARAAANAARQIGDTLLQSNLVQVHYYGLACPNNTPLATVRRERTSFFNSGGVLLNNQKMQKEQEQQQQQQQIIIIQEENNSNNDAARATKTSHPKHGSTTIGTPNNFVENLNIRLTSKCTLSMAKSLTNALRGRNQGGLPGVEALTLPYTSSTIGDDDCDCDCFEVACNVTDPKRGSSEMILERIDGWVVDMRKEMQRQLCFSRQNDGETPAAADDDDGTKCEYNYDYFVDKAYRVGTTEQQCVDVLTLMNKRVDIDDDVSIEDALKEHDEEVLRKFKELLQK